MKSEGYLINHPPKKPRKFACGHHTDGAEMVCGECYRQNLAKSDRWDSVKFVCGLPWILAHGLCLWLSEKLAKIGEGIIR